MKKDMYEYREGYELRPHRHPNAGYVVKSTVCEGRINDVYEDLIWDFYLHFVDVGNVMIHKTLKGVTMYSTHHELTVSEGLYFALMELYEDKVYPVDIICGYPTHTITVVVISD